MPNKQREIAIQFNQVTDALVIAVVYWLAHALREELAFCYPLTFSLIASFRYYKWLYLVILPLCPLLLDINGFYNRPIMLKWTQTMWMLLKSVTICVLVLIALLYFMNLGALSRGVV